MAYQLEICANSIASAIAAKNGGADRIELCDNITEDGTTPSAGQIKWCVENLDIEIWPLIRPRGGNFIYTAEEFETILLDIQFCKQIGCDGIVTGILDINNEIDLDRCSQIISAAYPMPVAFHRAIDTTNDLAKSLEKIIELGFVRVLTSGGENNAYTGRSVIAELIKQAKSRIEVMPGAGINEKNIHEIAKTTQAKCFHTTAKEEVTQVKVNAKSKFSVSNSPLTDRIYQTNSDKVKLLKDIIKNL
jgi:copper homeostasis protein